MDHNERQRIRRSKNGNAATKKYEKTKKGFLMRLYRNMQSRVCGVQKAKIHLYEGKHLIPREDFYSWAEDSREFHRLFSEWELSEYERKLTPSVDRVDPSRGYEAENMEWVTFSENCRRGGMAKRHTIPYKMIQG